MKGPETPKNKGEEINGPEKLIYALEGELSNMGLAKELSEGQKKIREIAEEYLEVHPEYFVWRKDKVGKKTLHYTSELVGIIRKRIERENAESPEFKLGEITNSALSKELNTTFQRLEKIANEYKEAHPEYFVWRKDQMGRRTWHYIPEFANILRERIKQEDIEVPQAKDGEINNKSLSDELNRGPKLIQQIADEYKDSHPEYFIWRRDKSGQKVLHFTPPLVDIIRTRIAQENMETPEIAPGEITNTALADELKRAPQSLYGIAHGYRESHPEYFLWKRGVNGQGSLHYSAEFANILRERIKQEDIEVPQAKDGEITNTALANQLEETGQRIQKIANGFKESHPEYFVWRRDTMGKKILHYTPELIELIKTKVSEENTESPKAMFGEITNTALAKKLNQSQQKLEKLANEYKGVHPEYFVWRRDVTGKKSLHYTNELRKILEDYIEEENIENPKAAPGEVAVKSLAKELHKAKQTIEAVAAKYKESNPEYFITRKNKLGKKSAFYTGELADIIRTSINSEGIAITALAEELGTSPYIIQKIADGYRNSNPEYFVLKKKGDQEFERYTPELIKIIREKFQENKEKEIEKNKDVSFAPEGWKMNSDICVEFGSQTSVVNRIVNKYRTDHPEYFKQFKNKKGQGARSFEHYSPEFVEIIRSEMRKIYEVPYAPDGWKTLSAIKTEIGQFVLFEKIVKENRQLHPEYFKEFRDGAGRVSEHYSPELVAILSKNVDSVSPAPEGWEPNRSLAKKLGVAQGTLAEIANKYRGSNPEYFKELRNKNYQNRILEHYSPEFIVILAGETKTLKETPLAPGGWLTRRKISDEMGVAWNSPIISSLVDQYHISNPEYFKEFKDGAGKISEHYHVDFLDIIRKEFEKTPRVIEGWMTKKALSRLSGLHYDKLSKLLDIYHADHPEYFKEMRPKRGALVEHISPELIQIILDQLNKTPSAPDGWLTQQGIADRLGINKEPVGKLVNKHRKANPEYFTPYKDTAGNIREHYSPDLIEIIKQEFSDIKRIKKLEEQEDFLKNKFENLIQEIGNKDTHDWEAKKIGELLQLLPGNAHDIILKYHPEYKGMKVGYVRKIIAEYLGDFMMVKKEWSGGDVERFKDVLDIKGIHDVILYNLKNACLTFVNQQRKINPNADEYLLVNEYFQQPAMRRLETSKIEEVRNAMTELREYYDQIFALRKKKPANIVDSLKKGRVFPDINQLLNIQEMQEKKKMLIADEMGLGKSASAIMTKEYLGLKCALVVIPSNVEETWENYLSDRIDPDTGKQLGYFKPGMTPRILMINSPKDLKRLTTETFDYILISQEKMTGKRYGDALEKVDFDMMIIDEVHKLKNIESGVRSQAVIKLAEKIQGENKYLTLLSGTPIPNKVQDIAISLKLLYPEKYKQFNNKDIVNRIIYGDLIDLRTEILMRTQMKELATSIEMPPLTEVDVPVDLSLVEREIYEILLEEDELTASDKIILFRQFLLNPELLSMEPGVTGAKIQKLEETLLEDLKTQDKIIVFVNGYVEGVIRGDTSIIKKMNLPDDVIIEEIHGEIDKVERKRIQDELKLPNRKTIVFVSGQTADVGVDFSAADGVIFYNEPWSKYDKKQEQARVYREGLKGPLTSKTLITRNSIEEGIRRYIDAKEKAVEKLLRGIQNTDAEKKLLHNDSKLTKNDVETNAELSKEYLSDWEKLMVHFGEGFEAGEKQFRKELPTKAVEYAQLYKKLGRLTYQGNNARVTATLIENMMTEQEQIPKDVKILDIASGPEMLKEAAQESLKDSIYSTDINAEHFMQSIKPKNTMASSYLNLPNLDKSVDYCNLGFAFHQTSPIKYYKKNYERLQVLAEMNRVLKPGGRAIISMLHNIKLGDGNKFEKLINQIGFKLIPDYSGEATGGQNYRAGFFTLEKISDTPKYVSDAMKFDNADNAKYIRELGDVLGKEFLEGLDMKKTSKGDSRLRDQRRMVDQITLGGEVREIIFNEKDRQLYSQEVQSIADGEALREKYGGIANIPLSEIENMGFERKLETPGYFLLYKIIENGGAVIIRGDYKTKKKKPVTA